MSFFLTTTELAFAVPGGVVLGAVVSFAAQRLTSADNLRSQKVAVAANRQLAADERFWKVRSDLYVQVIQATNDMHKAALKLRHENRRVMSTERGSLQEPLQNLQVFDAGISAFASDSVRMHYRAVSSAAIILEVALQEEIREVRRLVVEKQQREEAEDSPPAEHRAIEPTLAEAMKKRATDAQSTIDATAKFISALRSELRGEQLP